MSLIEICQCCGCGVTKSTLHDQISGKVTHGDKPRQISLLSAAEESKLGNILVKVSQDGYCKTRREVRQISGSVVIDKGKREKAIVSHGWFKGSY